MTKADFKQILKYGVPIAILLAGLGLLYYLSQRVAACAISMVGVAGVLMQWPTWLASVACAIIDTQTLIIALVGLYLSGKGIAMTWGALSNG
jgi:hypothetical protein